MTGNSAQHFSYNIQDLNCRGAIVPSFFSKSGSQLHPITSEYTGVAPASNVGVTRSAACQTSFSMPDGSSSSSTVPTVRLSSRDVADTVLDSVPTVFVSWSVS